MIDHKNQIGILFLALASIAIGIGYKRVPAVLLAKSAAIFLTSRVKPNPQDPSESKAAPKMLIGGQPVVRLRRKPTQNSKTPEFLSATILPGRGMNLFQITANVPGKGEVQVFASPSLEEAAKKLTGGTDDAFGVQSFAFGGAFLAPYPNRIRGKLSPDGKTIETEWHGKRLRLPAVWKGKANPHAEPHAIHGLILDQKTEVGKIKTTPDGQTVTGVIHAGDFRGFWLSRTDITIGIALAGKKVEATITASNVGSEEEPMGIGWHPYFAIPSGDRKQARLNIPASQLAGVNNYDDVFPTGKLLPVSGTKYDFSSPEGKALENIFLDDNFSELHRTGDSVVVGLTDPASNYGIHIVGDSKEINTIQVYAPPDKPFAAIEEQLNFADPFSDVWKGRDTGMVTLKPRQSVTWKVSLKIFALR